MKVLLLTDNKINELGQRHARARVYCERFLEAMSFAEINEPKDFVKAFKGNLINGKVVLINDKLTVGYNPLYGKG